MTMTIVQVHLDPVLCTSSPVPGHQEDAVTGDFDDDDDDDDDDNHDHDHDYEEEGDDEDDETANIKTNQTKWCLAIRKILPQVMMMMSHH